MNTINLKYALSCLLLGTGYLLSNAQGVVVYKTDGSQIKVPYEQLDSIAVYADDDNPVNPSVDPISAIDLSGEWEDGGLGYSCGYSLSFNKNDVFVKEDGNVVYQGQYTIENNVVSFVMDGVTYRSAAGLAGEKSVLMVKRVIVDTNQTRMTRAADNGEQEELAFVLVKKGKTINTNKADIQGQWLCWWTPSPEEGMIVRMAFKFEGDNFEVIITPWGQKYTGTYTYVNGIVTFNVKAGFTSRQEGTGYGSLWGDLDPVTLEGTWRTLYQEYWTFVDGGPFIAIGDEAFGLILLPSLCTRKK